MVESVWIVLIAVNLHISIVGSKRVIIYDTLKESALKWTTNSQIPEEGWIEESITDIRDGINARSYVTCEVEKENVDNWLRMPYVERGDGRRLSLEIRFTVRDCKLYPRLARTCKETFTLYAYESDLNFASKNEPAWSDKVYKRVDRITADLGRFSDRRNVQTNVEVRSVPVTKKGVYFAFRDEGACVSILGVKIFYEVCEETVTNFAWFAETPSGPDLSSIQSTVGHCVENASPPSGVQPKYVCKADGTWDLLNGGCQCNRGYRADGQRCIACEPGTFKENQGFGLCQPCPDRSTALGTSATHCVCDAGYYRAFEDPKSAPCTRPPSRPERAELISVDQTSAVLNWNQPSDLGGRSDLWYRIECQECPPGAQYSPAKTRFNATRLTLTNLEPDVVYTVFVYAENDVSVQVDGLPMYAVVEVQTKASSPWHIANFRIESVADSQVTLSWDPPRISMDYEPLINRANKNDLIYGLETELDRRRSRQSVKYYEIRYHRTHDKKSLFDRTTSNETKITLNNLVDNMDYFFEVRPYTSKGWGAWSEKKHARTSASMNLTQEKSTSTATIAITIFSFVLLILVLIFLLFLRGRILPRWYKKRTSDLDTLEYKTDQTNISPDYHSVGVYNRKFTSPFIYPTVKPYVDPTTYEDPNMMLKEFTNEIDVSSVFIEEIIGAGEFGEVCKGYLKLAAEPETAVAIKTLKPGSSNKDKSDFLTEASIMGQFNHPNVIKLVGVVSKAEPVMIVTEYVENRSLDSFLRANDGKLTSIQLVHMLCGIAQGMKYLNEKGFIHRDLAARNVLVSADLTCKIADFGLSRGVGGSADLVYTTKGGKIPVRWTAPEAIKFRKFTSASDVWSFGILMWEVMSFGERPYWDWTNQVVIQKVDEGFRLPPPMDCPAPLHRLMSECWNKDRQYRPSFVSIIQTLQNFVRCPELLYAATVYPPFDPINNHCLLNLNSVTPPTVHYNSRPAPPPPPTNHHRATPTHCGYGTLHRRPTIVDQSDCVVGQIIMDTVLYDENRRTPINNCVGQQQQQQQQSGLYCLKRLPQPRIV